MAHTPLVHRFQRFILSFLCPQTVRTNRNSGLIRLLACTFMLIDHVGKMLFPQIPALRLIGRLAFPMFAYGIAVGAVCTRNPLRYLSRIVLLMLVSQPLYALALDHETAAMYAVPFASDPLGAIRAFYIGSWGKPSILLTLALGLCLLLALRRRQWILALGIYVICCRFSAQLDYGIGGIRLMLLFYLLCEHPLAALAAVTAYMLAWAGGTGYTFFGHSFGMRIFALPAAVFCCLPFQKRFTLPRWLSYGFYPAHLAVLAILVRIL